MFGGKLFSAIGAVVIVSFLLVISVFSVSAQLQPSWLLYAREGEVYKLNPATGQEVSLTRHFWREEGFGFTSPQWSSDGQFVAMVLSTEPQADLPTGRIWVITAEKQLIADIQECQQSGVECGNPQLSKDGQWLVYMLIQNGEPTARLYNLKSGFKTTLQEGGFDPFHSASRWLTEDEFALVGTFEPGEHIVERRIFLIGTGYGFKVDQNTGIPGVAFTGCNQETVSKTIQTNRISVEIWRDGQKLKALPNVQLARGNPWQNCKYVVAPRPQMTPTPTGG
jgi:hypothetical protein